MKNTFQLLIDAKQATKTSAFLTPWGIRECKSMTLTEISATFGKVAAEFWQAVRTGKILFK